MSWLHPKWRTWENLTERRVLFVLILIMLAGLVSAPLTRWPASVIYFTTGKTLEQSIDSDGDGLWEVAEIYDCDGDGSAYVTCTAKDTPDLACKAAGEIVYRDTIDDTNCMVHTKMEQTGTIKYRDGVVYVMWGCWNATTNDNDPAQMDSTTPATASELHDDNTDDAYSSCWTDSDGFIMSDISMQSWQGTLQGAGTDRRYLPQATIDATGLKRDKGTYFVDDMGPARQYAGTSDNDWFGWTGGHRILSSGYHAGKHLTDGVAAGQGVMGGDSKGWGVQAKDQDWTKWQGNAATCLCNTLDAGDCSGGVGTDFSASGWAANLVNGDILVMKAKASPDATGIHNVSVRVVGVDIPGGCAGGEAEIHFGGSKSSWAANNDVHPYHADSIAASDNRIAIHARSDYNQTDTHVKNLTLQHQDWWNEEGGDCPENYSTRVKYNGTGTNDALSFPGRYDSTADILIRRTSAAGVTSTMVLTTDYTVDLSTGSYGNDCVTDGQCINVVDGATDFAVGDTWTISHDPKTWSFANDGAAGINFECDAQHMIGNWGNGKMLYEDLVIGPWASYAIDGGHAGSHPIMRNSVFQYGLGTEITDANQFYEFDHVLITDSDFNSGIMGTIATVNNRWRNVEIRNSRFRSIFTFSPGNSLNSFENIVVNSSSFEYGFEFLCGARWNVIDGFYITGRQQTRAGAGIGAPIGFRCDKPSSPASTWNPTYGNRIKNVIEWPKGGGNSGTDGGPLVTFNAANATSADQDPWNGMIGNTIEGISQNGIGGVSGDDATCLIAAVDTDSAGDDGESIVFTKNSFYGNTSSEDGRIFCVWATGNTAHPILSETATPAWGDPIGFGNIDGNALIPYERTPPPKSGTDPTACSELWQIYVDTDSSTDTNCITAHDGSLCVCTATGTPGTWVAID